MDSNQLRRVFLEYFQKLGHEIVPSSSLVPAHDPSLLFTNAGMVQFKEILLGIEKPTFLRATSAQRCVRAGGKHNDLENVGYTKRHHTFFEMLGNFSFGDYSKREAIEFAWNFLTKVLKLPAERLWITVFHDDQESEDIWLKTLKVDPSRFSRCGEKDNFWSMGEVGPCGPCTEIFYDHGPEISGGPPGTPEEEGDRFVEIWNLVFMQYDRDQSGDLKPLPKLCVDTGMGLERIVAALQGVHDNYDIDIFQHLLKALSEIVAKEDFADPSMRVIADHIRSASFLIMDGVMPLNEGRGYVLRRIIRRAVRHGARLGMEHTFFYRLVPALVETMGDAYPELRVAEPLIQQVIEQEEIQFSKTLHHGLKVFEKAVAELQGEQIPGEVVFQLYDTYGFPPDLTADIARERHLSIDELGFEAAMNKQRHLSHQAKKFHLDTSALVDIPGETEFLGYEKTTADGVVTHLLKDNQSVSELKPGEHGVVVLDRTPFYAAAGGQVGDKGYLHFAQGAFRVTDTQKHGHVYLHAGELLKGHLFLNDPVHAEVGPSRQEIVLNHSATHLLHEALRRVLGDHVVQKGSLVESKRLRFDFSHPKSLTQEELYAIEHMVNQQIRENLPSKVTVCSLEEAKKVGATALFGEKYGNEVRVVEMGGFSKEVCGGTHTQNTGEIGLFKIVSEGASASGIRRIEAITGKEALYYVEENERKINEISAIFKVGSGDIKEKLEHLYEQNRALGKEVDRLKQQLANMEGGSIAEQAIDIQGIKVLAKKVTITDSHALRSTLDNLKQKLGKAAIVLASVDENKIRLVAGVSKECLPSFNAADLLSHVAGQVGGKGGGRPEFAQGGGTDLEALPLALKGVVSWVKNKLEHDKK